MRSWIILLGGLALWAVHFFGLYFTGSIFLSSGTARSIAGLFTLACAAATLLLMAWINRQSEAVLAGWVSPAGRAGAVLALIAIIWQGLPVLF
ncbi:hypothetical protein [Allosphingosinicella vermicomposti]|uniref:hypothetical protein n=1 Tax=Allosphingosinicella vermicomposti TaxID=614671 RepID=UPI000D0EB754|nr:hypothetical protein [Allosphingosinicella vermicomposti]